MADSDFALTVATPERMLVDERASDATIPARNGYIGVLPGHAPLLSELSSGAMTWNSGGQTKTIVVMGGFVEVLGDRVRVLADAARRKEEIDSGAAKQRLDQAQQALAKPPVENPTPEDWDRLLEEVQKAQAEVDTAAK
jgi:F-type H+-transporting ATPase subunit epsilon